MSTTCPCHASAPRAADELEASRAAEARLRQHTRDAIQAAEAEAHRKVEDSYQEASFAVQKALERVDAAAAEAAEAQARSKALEGADAAARADLRAAQEEAGRCGGADVALSTCVWACFRVLDIGSCVD